METNTTERCRVEALQSETPRGERVNEWDLAVATETCECEECAIVTRLLAAEAKIAASQQQAPEVARS